MISDYKVMAEKVFTIEEGNKNMKLEVDLIRLKYKEDLAFNTKLIWDDAKNRID